MTRWKSAFVAGILQCWAYASHRRVHIHVRGSLAMLVPGAVMFGIGAFVTGRRDGNRVWEKGATSEQDPASKKKEKSVIDHPSINWPPSWPVGNDKCGRT